MGYDQGGWFCVFTGSVHRLVGIYLNSSWQLKSPGSEEPGDLWQIQAKYTFGSEIRMHVSSQCLLFYPFTPVVWYIRSLLK